MTTLSEIEKTACKYADKTVYIFMVRDYNEIPECDFHAIALCLSYENYVLCPDKWLRDKKPNEIKGVIILGQIECK